MKYQPPFKWPIPGSLPAGIHNDDPDAPYVNANPATGTEGSYPPAEAIEHTQREIMAVITDAALTPSHTDLTQLLQAIRKIIKSYFVTDTLTLYVRSDGDDVNGDGSANTSAKAFATIARAIAYSFEERFMGGNQLRIILGNAGTYAPAAIPFGGNVRIEGATAAPDSYIIAGTPAHGSGMMAADGSQLVLHNVKLDNQTAAANTLSALGNGIVTLGTVKFTGVNATTGAIINAQSGGLITVDTSLGTVIDVAGNKNFMISADGGSVVITAGAHINVTGTPTYNSQTVRATFAGLVRFFDAFTGGAVTGQRYDARQNGIINTNGGGANFIPGSIAGTTATQGLYG